MLPFCFGTCTFDIQELDLGPKRYYLAAIVMLRGHATVQSRTGATCSVALRLVGRALISACKNLHFSYCTHACYLSIPKGKLPNVVPAPQSLNPQVPSYFLRLHASQSVFRTSDRVCWAIPTQPPASSAKPPTTRDYPGPCRAETHRRYRPFPE